MARPNQVPESSMEEILASIRKIISEDEAKPTVLRPTIAPLPDAPKAAANNVSRLFADEPAEPPVSEQATVDATQAEPADGFHAQVELVSEDPTLSFPRYHDEELEAGAEPELETEPEPEPEPVQARTQERRMTIEPAAAVEAALSTPDWKPAPQQQPTLLSPRADAAVASAFNHLAGTILANNSRTIEQMAEDMMRPMLKDWLDDNLPPLVERLVREEIERVSRRR
jgi:cell pole-organizing protein PopZ